MAQVDNRDLRYVSSAFHDFWKETQERQTS